MTTFPNQKRFAGAESHRSLYISKPLIDAFLKTHPREHDLLNSLGIDFRTSIKFNKYTLDERVIAEEDNLRSRPRLSASVGLYKLYHDYLVEDIKKLKGRPIIFTPAFGHCESSPGGEDYASVIGDDYFSNSFRLSREYIESASKVYYKLGKVPDVVLIPVAAPIVFPCSFEEDSGCVKLVHALKNTCIRSNEKTSYKQQFNTLEKSLLTLDKTFFENYSLSPSYFYGDPKFENRTDPYHNLKEMHRKINRTLVSYSLAYIINELGIERVRSHLPSSGFEADILKGAVRLAGAKYIPSDPLSGVSLPKNGLCCVEAQRILVRAILNFYDTADPQMDLFGGE